MSGTGLKDKIYNKLPVLLQDAACSWYGLQVRKQRFNTSFRTKLTELLKSEWYSASEIEAYQNEKIRQLIAYVYVNVPYYSEIMHALKLRPDDITCKEDLKKLPLLTKEDVRQNKDKLLSGSADLKKLSFSHTSGTTGKSLQFYVSKEQIPFQWAIWWRHRERFGVNPGMLHANFTGKIAIDPLQKKPPYWRWNLPMHQAILTMHHIQKDKIASIIDFLNKHEFVYYSGYPSIIGSLCEMGLELGINLVHKPAFIFPGAENTLVSQRHVIEKFTDAVITDQYGFSEGCGNASQCKEFNYHEDFEFGVMECVDEELLPGGRKRGKIVCTGFASPEFPFIRYAVGDSGVWEHPDKQCPCGRHSAVITEIEGRIDDYVVTPDGRKVMRFDYLFKDTLNVKECQIVQYEKNAIVIRLVRRNEYSARDEQFIRGEVEKWISKDLQVNFDYVNEIEREKNGKFRAVKSFLDKNKEKPGNT